MIVHLKRVIEDTTFMTKFIKIKAVGVERTINAFRIDLPDDKQISEIEAAGFPVAHKDHMFISLGLFLDNLKDIIND